MDLDNKSWSNMRGYGKINIYDYDSKTDKLDINTFKFNRIDDLKTPYTTSVNTTMAWSGKSIESDNYNYKK